MRRTLIIVWGSLLCLSGSLYASNLSKPKVFKDWVVACNNLRVCSGVSFVLPAFDADDSSEYDAVIKLSRGAGATAKPVIRIMPGFMEEVSEELAGQPFVLQAGAQSLSVGEYPSGNNGGVIPAKFVPSFLAMIKAPSVLTIKVGERNFRASLRGVSAAMLYIDDKQQRLGTTSALIRTGGRKMNAVAPVVKTMNTQKAPANMELPQGLAARIRREQPALLSECGGGGNDALDFAKPLDDQHYLVAVNCLMAAYNSSSLLYVVAVDSVTAAKLKATPAKIEQDAEYGAANEVSGADFSEQAGILSSYYKGRGLGDCGSYIEWGWNGQRFVLIKFEAMSDCRGVPEFLNIWEVPVR